MLVRVVKVFDLGERGRGSAVTGSVRLQRLNRCNGVGVNAVYLSSSGRCLLLPFLGVARECDDNGEPGMFQDSLVRDVGPEHQLIDQQIKRAAEVVCDFSNKHAEWQRNDFDAADFKGPRVRIRIALGDGFVRAVPDKRTELAVE